MAWKFDPFLVQLVWVPSANTQEEFANIDFGDSTESDIEISMGDRTNESSIIDQGLRVSDGSI